MDGTKHDQSKPAFHLIDARFDLEVLGADDWQRGTEKGQDLRCWAARSDGASIKRVFWYVATLYNTDNPQRTARLELARVLHFGAEKYSPQNWRKGFKWSRLWRAAYSHIEAHKAGDIYDDEAGLLHLSHALCCLMFLIVHERDGLGEDDRAEIWPEVAPAVDEDPQTDVAVDLVGFTQPRAAQQRVALWRTPAGHIIELDISKGWYSTDTMSSAECDAVTAVESKMRAISWPEVEPQIQYESGCGVHFKLLSVDWERAAWRCVASGAHGYIKRDKTWHWLSSSLSTPADNKATDCETTRADLVAASWPG